MLVLHIGIESCRIEALLRALRAVRISDRLQRQVDSIEAAAEFAIEQQRDVLRRRDRLFEIARLAVPQGDPDQADDQRDDRRDSEDVDQPARPPHRRRPAGRPGTAPAGFGAAGHRNGTQGHIQERRGHDHKEHALGRR